MAEVVGQGVVRNNSEQQAPLLNQIVLDELAGYISDKKSLEKAALTYQAIAQYVNETFNLFQNNPNHLFYQWGTETARSFDLSPNPPLSEKRIVDFMDQWERFMTSKKVREVFGEDSLRIAEKRFGFEVKQKVIDGKQEIINNLHNLKNRPQIITPIIKDNKVPELVVEKFFKSSLGSEYSKPSFLYENPFILGLLVEYASTHPNEELKDLVRTLDGEIVDFYADQEGVSDQSLEHLSKVFVQEKSDIRKAIELAKSQKPSDKYFESGTFGRMDKSTVGTLSLLIELSGNVNMVSMLSDLAKLGHKIALGRYVSRGKEDYVSALNNLLKQKEVLLPFMQELYEHAGNPHLFSYIDGDALRIIESLAENKDKLFASIDEVRKYRRGFVYSLNTRTPYVQVVNGDIYSNNHPISHEELAAVRKDKGSIPHDFLSPLFERMTSSLGKNIDKNTLMSIFEKEINVILDHVEKDPNIEWFYSNESFLRAFAVGLVNNKPLADFPDKFPRLMVLMEEGGTLNANRTYAMRDIFENANIDKRAKELERAFTTQQPYWKSLYLFTLAKFKKELMQAKVDYPIHSVTGIPIRTLVKRHGSYVTDNGEIINALAKGEIDSIPFKELTEFGKKEVFRDYFRRVVETSRDERAKSIAEERNKGLSKKPLVLDDGDYIHGTSVISLAQILLNGNLGGNTFKEVAYDDDFYVNFSRVVDAKAYENVYDILRDSISWTYSRSVVRGHDDRNLSDQLFLVYKRSQSIWEHGVDNLREELGHKNPRHALMFVGVPSTEIGGIVLRNASVLEKTKRSVVENGFYIPIYDLQGEILFTSEDYDAMRTDRNIGNVPVEVWDNSLKTGEQKGSNPAAEFTVQGKNGSERFYVKFQSETNGDQIWNELLADKLYKALGISVPETKAVKIEGVYGRASKLVSGVVDGSSGSQNWKKGYLADCLLANWDIVSALEQNTVSIPRTGEVFRVDNGGAMLYRARGERKAEKDFGETVNELSEISPISPEKMGITGDDLSFQAQIIKEKLKDDIIDGLVDSVRLRRKDRDYLRDVLKKRRDFITNKYGRFYI